MDGDDNAVVMRCILRGYIENIGIGSPDSQQFDTRGMLARIHPSSLCPVGPVIVYKEIVQTSDAFMRMCGAVLQDWVDEIVEAIK